MRWLRCLLIGVMVAAGVNMTPTTPVLEIAPAEVEIVGADISFTLQEEAVGNSVSDNGKTLPIEEILARHGTNYSRLRVFVDPQGGASGLESALEMAKRSRAAGMKLLLNLHYSGTWADHERQEPPAAWKDLNFDELTGEVRSYTKGVLEAFARQGTPVSMVQLGNEVTNGILWPAGRINGPDGVRWEGFAQLVKAAAAGVRDSNAVNPPLIVLHIHGGGGGKVTRDFFDTATKHNIPFDVIGLTYYPFWGPSLGRLGRNLTFLANRYDRDIMIVETAYPWTLETSQDGPNIVRRASMLPQSELYPPTPEGQAKFFRGLRRVLANVPSGHGVGYFVWEPGWLPGVDAAVDGGNGYSNLTLFDWEGRALPALRELTAAY